MPRLTLPRIAGLALLLLAGGCGLLPPAPGSGIAKPDSRTSTRETSAQETQRLRDQRERATEDGVLVFSAGTLAGTKPTHGAELAFQFEQIRALSGDEAQPGTLGIPLDCRVGNCQVRSFKLGSRSRKANTRVTVATLQPGLWKLSAVRVSEQPPIRLRRIAPFEIKRGYATYLGAFVLTGQRAGTRKPDVPLARFSAVQSDMSVALDVFEQTRGRKLLNAVSKQIKTQILK